MANNMVNINFRMDSELKNMMEQICNDIGLSMTSAFTIYAKKVVKEHGIPFDLTADPFYSESNMKHLEYMDNKIKNGQAHFSEHELIEVDD